jgi:hypothetical protein
MHRHITSYYRGLLYMFARSRKRYARGAILPLKRGGISAAIGGALMLLLCSGVIAATICGSCGYEGSDTARFCSHCGAGLAANVGAESATRVGASPSTGGAGLSAGADQRSVAKGGKIATEVVAEDMTRARKHMELEHVDLAKLFGRNALALNLLSGDDPDALRSKAILRFIDQCARAEGQVRQRCPVCSGTGKRVMTAAALSGGSREMQIGGSRCDRCGGSGRIRGGETIDERKYRLGQADKKYRTLQQSHGRVPVGLCWVPAEVQDTLALADSIALKRALPPPCSDCVGIGRSDCTSCRGRGKVKCGAKGCERGLVETESFGGRIGAKSRSGGGKATHTIPCKTCGGTALEACEKCSGAGSFLCRSCDGSGLGDICAKCSGSGSLPCRRCGGSLVYRGVPCTTCHAEGIVACSSCVGTGRK